MRIILADILTLSQHLAALQQSIEPYRPAHCPYCSHSMVWCHGFYERKADRVNPHTVSLNPIPIPRFRCAECRPTFSVLPECIPPHRWYLWCVQQLGLSACLVGLSFRQLSRQLPMARSTISRWFQWLTERSADFQKALYAVFSEMGYFSKLSAFWPAWFNQHRLSKAMWWLSRSGLCVP